MTRAKKTPEQPLTDAQKTDKQARGKHVASRKEGEVTEPRAPYGRTYPEELENEDVRDRTHHDDRRNDNGKF